jgi:hypothetical protein
MISTNELDAKMAAYKRASEANLLEPSEAKFGALIWKPC